MSLTRALISPVVANLAALRALSRVTAANAFVLSHTNMGDGGGGPYAYDSTDTVSADNDGSIIVCNDGARRKLAQNWASVCQFGGKGDGTDESAIVQKTIDAMKGKRIVIDEGKTFSIAGVKLDGATYNGTHIECRGWFKLLPDGGASVYGGAWVGVLLKQCDGVRIEPRFDGNRAAMTAREQIFCVGLAGATNTLMPTSEFKEIRGDGVYVGQVDWTANSANSQNLRIGRIVGTNSANDGRNLVSIISCVGWSIEEFKSVQIGGTILGTIQPGGLDIEPDHGYQTVAYGYVGRLDATTAGTSGCGIVGKSISGVDANRDWNCFDITFGSIRVERTGTAGSAIGGGLFSRCADVRVLDGTVQYTGGTAGAGYVFDFCQRMKANIKATTVTYGVWLGPADQVQYSDIRCEATGYSVAALRATGSASNEIYVKAYGSKAGATAFACQTLSNGRGVTQTDTHYFVDAPYDGNVARAFRNEPGDTVAYGAGTEVRGGDWTGYANPSVTIDATIPRSHVRGLLQTVAMPSSGAWAAGDFVACVPANMGTPGKALTGWLRLTTGSGQVAGTDWTNVYGSTS